MTQNDSKEINVLQIPRKCKSVQRKVSLARSSCAITNVLLPVTYFHV